MNFQRILVPADFSERSQSALVLATSLARDCGATLMIVYVQEPPVQLSAEGGMPFVDVPVATEALKEELERIVPTDPQVPCEHHLLIGAPATEIVRFARQENADLIVMNTHGRKGLSHLLMGSVAEAVVRHAPCPVLTMKTPKER
jgi:nucleotide-binding universal stress UspA family protein